MESKDRHKRIDDEVGEGALNLREVEAVDEGRPIPPPTFTFKSRYLPREHGSKEDDWFL